MNPYFPNLFAPIKLGRCQLKNRIVSTGHHTYLSDGSPNDCLIAYHAARAQGGAGLIITEIVAVHETAGFSSQLLRANDRSGIADYRRLVKACQRHDTRIIAQLFHPGREVLATPSGMAPIAWAPSAVPNERFHIMPKAMPETLISDIIAGYGKSAAYLAEAGIDGFEIVASHGYLPAQFLNPEINLRNDRYGGDFERRLQFLHDVIATIRAITPDQALGVRLSGDEIAGQGGERADTVAIAQELAGSIDFFSIVAGTSASLGGSVHIVPPMGLDHGYTAPLAAAVRAATRKPVIVTGRINQPQIAEQILMRGDADLCGMTRAMICDAEFANKSRNGRFEEIRACIGCNQACIGRANKSLGISCIQNPISGRELEFKSLPPIDKVKKILVIGGGPAGMKAAAVAGERGHAVTLWEKASQLGGQVRLAQSLPGREEFGGIIDNFEREMMGADVTISKNKTATLQAIDAYQPDQVILASGARPYVPSEVAFDEAHVVTAWDVLGQRANVGKSVVIADWRADWIGLGLAELLAANGCTVTLCTNAAMAGESLQIYTRNHYVGRLHKLGVTIKTHCRLFGADAQTAYFQDTLTEDPVVIEGVDSLVLALGHQPDDTLEQDLVRSQIPTTSIGDCVVPRTAEEAIFEGFKVGWAV